MEDIAPALLEQLKELYKNEKNSSIKIKNILDKLKEKNANFVDASEYANELGEILSRIFGGIFSVEVLPDGKMYYNIAKRTVEPTLKDLQTDIADLMEELQENVNKQAGLGIKPIRAELNQDKIDGIIDRLAEAESYEDIKWILQEPVKTFARSVVDDAILANVEFQGKSGLTPKIIRKSSGNCCDWCTNLVGEYNYPNVPKDVYRRHNRCRCTVEFVTGKRKQNVWNKAWSEEITPEKIDERKAVPYGEKQKKITTFTPAKTVEQAERYAHNMGVKYVEYGKLPLETINDVNKAISMLPEDARPLYVGDSRNLEKAFCGNQGKLPRKHNQFYGVTMDSSAFGMYHKDDNGVYRLDYNEGGQMLGISSVHNTTAKITKSKIESQIKYRERYGNDWFFNVTGETTAMHEAGHCFINAKGMPEGFEYVANSWAVKSKCDMLKNPSEAWAEAWASYHTGVNVDKVPSGVLEYIRKAVE